MECPHVGIGICKREANIYTKSSEQEERWRQTDLCSSSHEEEEEEERTKGHHLHKHIAIYKNMWYMTTETKGQWTIYKQGSSMSQGQTWKHRKPGSLQYPRSYQWSTCDTKCHLKMNERWRPQEKVGPHKSKIKGGPPSKLKGTQP